MVATGGYAHHFYILGDGGTRIVVEGGGVGAAGVLHPIMNPGDGGIVGTVGDGESDWGVAADSVRLVNSHVGGGDGVECDGEIDRILVIADPKMATHETLLGRGDEMGGHIALIIVGAAYDAGKSVANGIEDEFPLIIAGDEEWGVVALELEGLNTRIGGGNDGNGVVGTEGGGRPTRVAQSLEQKGDSGSMAWT